MTEQELEWFDRRCEEEAEVLVLEPREYFDKALIGLGSQPCKPVCAVYDAAKVVEATVAWFRGEHVADSDDKPTEAEWWERAQEWCDFNTFGGYLGENTFIFVRTPSTD